MTSTPMKTRRSPRTASVWKSLVEGWLSSGLSATAYADEHDVSAEGLWRWRHRLRQREHSGVGDTVQAPGASPTMVRVHVVGNGEDTGVDAVGHIELRCPGGYVLSLHGAVHAAQLTTVLQTLARVQPC